VESLEVFLREDDRKHAVLEAAASTGQVDGQSNAP
jgi:hypothetical protein